MSKILERRWVQSELRTADKNGAPMIVGHAAVFNTPVDIGWGFRENVKPGAFAKTINEADVRALFNHDPNIVLGRNVSKTLRLSEDSTGLYYEIDLPDTQAARDLHTLAERGDVTQSSYAFIPVREEWTAGQDGQPDQRDLMEVELYDVSPVTYPAFPTTDAQARSFLQSAGFEPDVLARIMFKHERGLDLSSDERVQLRAVLDRFAGIASHVQPDAGTGGAPLDELLTSNAGACEMRLRLALGELG